VEVNVAMPEKTCVVCHQNEAAHRCIQCHKPVCDDCAFKDAYGVFCSRECSANNQAYRQEQAREAGKSGAFGGLVKAVLVILLLAVIAGAGYLYGAKKGWFGEEAKEKVIEGQREIQNKIPK
jgi:hypothetical protein